MNLNELKRLAGISESEFNDFDVDRDDQLEANELTYDYVKDMVEQEVAGGEDDLNRALGYVCKTLCDIGYNPDVVNKLIDRVGVELNDDKDNLIETKEPVYYSVFATDGGRWFHQFDADNSEDAKDEARSLRDAGLRVKIYVVPQSQANWVEKDPNEFVKSKLEQ